MAAILLAAVGLALWIVVPIMVGIFTVGFFIYIAYNLINDHEKTLEQHKLRKK